LTLFSESLLFSLLDPEEGGSALTVGNGLLVEQKSINASPWWQRFFLFVLLEKKFVYFKQSKHFNLPSKTANNSDFEKMKDGKF